MKSLRKSLISIFVAMFLVMSTGFCLSVAFADETTTAPTVSVTLENGAAVRTTQPYGIMFKANVNATKLINHYGEENVTFGMLICPADYVTADKPLKIGVENGLTEYVNGGSYENTYVNKTATPNDNGTYTCNLININENNLSRPYMAVAYVAIKNGDTVEYTYSSTFSRSIYTVAAYALVNDALIEEGADGKLDVDAQTYLSGVLDKVHETYKTLNVTASKTTFDGDNDFSVKSATVSNGKRELETCVTLSSDNIVQNEVNAYTANKLGEFTVTATVGKLTATLSGFNCKTVVLDIPTQLTLSWGDLSNLSLTKQTTAIGGCSEDVYQWNNTTYGLKVTSEIQHQMKEGVYLYIDLYSSQPVAKNWKGFLLNFAGNTNDTHSLYSGSDGQSTGAVTFENVVDYRLLDDHNNHIKDNIGYISNQWATLEFKMLSDLSNGRVGIQNNTVTDTSDNTFYIKNVRISTEQEKATTRTVSILNTEQDLTNGNMYPLANSKTKLEYVNEIAGKQNVFKWSATTDVETDSEGTAGSLLKFSTDFSNILYKNNYLVFDLYINQRVNIAFNFGNGDCLLYSDSFKTSEIFSFFDENGEKITTGNFSSGLSNKWITVQICLGENYLFDSLYRGIYIYNNSWGNPLMNSNVYFANVRCATAPLYGTSTITENA